MEKLDAGCFEKVKVQKLISTYARNYYLENS